MSQHPPSLPLDRAFAGANALLDRRAVTDILRRGPNAPTIDGLDLRYLEFQPGERIVVQYRAATPGGGRLVALDAAVALDGARTVSEGCWLDERTGALAGWDPNDPALPALADPAAALADLGLTAGEVRRLAWVPRRRAAVLVGDAVLKIYADADEARDAVRGMSAAFGVVPTAGLLAASVNCVAQERIEGRALGSRDTLGAIDDIAVALRELERLRTADLPTRRPSDLLDMVRMPVHLASWALPRIGERCAELVERLRECAPVVESVPAHGDFNAGQLVIGLDGVTRVIDLDTACLAPAGFDMAACAANLLSGRPGDLERADRLAEELVQRLGHPAGLDWLLAVSVLRRVDRPIRRLKSGWPARVGRLVDDAAQLVRRLG